MNLQFEFDIFDNKDLIKKFCEFNNLEYNDYQSIFSKYFLQNTCNYYFPNNNCNYSSIDFNNLKINDDIVVNYLPYSQKYLDYYEDKNTYGKVFFLDKENYNGLIYYDKKDTNNIITRYINSIEKEYCSYYGDTPGYCTFIYKIN